MFVCICFPLGIVNVIYYVLEFCIKQGIQKTKNLYIVSVGSLFRQSQYIFR